MVNGLYIYSIFLYPHLSVPSFTSTYIHKPMGHIRVNEVCSVLCVVVESNPQFSLEGNCSNHSSTAAHYNKIEKKEIKLVNIYVYKQKHKGKFI